MNLGKSIKLGLINKGMTQLSLAKTLGVTPAHLSRVATGKATMNAAMLERIAAEFGMKVSDFIAMGED